MWLEIENSSQYCTQAKGIFNFKLYCSAGKKLMYGHWPWHGKYSMLAYHIVSLCKKKYANMEEGLNGVNRQPSNSQEK